MTHSESGARMTRLSLLLFTAGGTGFGIHVSQIIGSLVSATEPDNMISGLPWQSCLKPEARLTLVFRAAGSTGYEIPVDSIDEIADVCVSEILPFPSFIESMVLSKGLWGVLPRDGRIFLLMDFARFLQYRLQC